MSLAQRYTMQAIDNAKNVYPAIDLNNIDGYTSIAVKKRIATISAAMKFMSTQSVPSFSFANPLDTNKPARKPASWEASSQHRLNVLRADLPSMSKIESRA